MTIRFTKMHGLGNDFMVIDGINQSFDLTPAQITSLARRDTGVGFDQCLVVEPSSKSGVDFFYRIYNADGSEVGQCGNGARCLARFIHHYGLSPKMTLTVETRTTQMSLQIHDNESVTVAFSPPNWDDQLHHIIIDNHSYPFYTIDVGNPHAVILTNDTQSAPVQAVGKQLSSHTMFPFQCNIGFVQIIDSKHLQCRVYERGCGETQACGSGAVAAAAIGMLHHGLERDVTVSLLGGDLSIQWPHNKSPIYLTGEATFIYEGVLL